MFQSYNTLLSVTLTGNVNVSELPEFAPCDCAEIYQKCMTEDAVAPSSGIYTIYIGDPITPVKVYCDMEENGGGWTVSKGVLWHGEKT